MNPFERSVIKREAERMKRLEGEATRLKQGILDHMAAVCDNPKANGGAADEALWALVAEDQLSEP